jgi:hypothetical protein
MKENLIMIINRIKQKKIEIVYIIIGFFIGFTNMLITDFIYTFCRTNDFYLSLITSNFYFSSLHSHILPALFYSVIFLFIY